MHYCTVAEDSSDLWSQLTSVFVEPFSLSLFLSLNYITFVWCFKHLKGKFGSNNNKKNGSRSGFDFPLQKVKGIFAHETNREATEGIGSEF